MFYYNVLKTSERRILNTKPFQNHCKTFWKRLVFAGEEAYPRAGLITALYVAMSVSFCLSHPVVVSVFYDL